jgi:hypothetical protein
MNGNKAFVAVAVTTALGILGAASALAGQDDMNERGDRGGFVRPCSLDGVNPIHHPEIFANPVAAAREYGFIRSRDGAWHVEPNCHR